MIRVPLLAAQLAAKDYTGTPVVYTMYQVPGIVEDQQGDSEGGAEESEEKPE